MDIPISEVSENAARKRVRRNPLDIVLFPIGVDHPKPIVRSELNKQESAVRLLNFRQSVEHGNQAILNRLVYALQTVVEILIQQQDLILNFLL